MPKQEDPRRERRQDDGRMWELLAYVLAIGVAAVAAFLLWRFFGK